ncbi:hypothetical protein [Aggregatibacter actinomycetemcomitans]|nr:hypothetical protein [Aggregatibacter actinomycetemcomitans]
MIKQWFSAKDLEGLKVDNWQAFDGAQRITIKTGLNYHGEYEDNLVYKF